MPRQLSPSLRSSTLTHSQPKEQCGNTPRYLVDAIEKVLDRRIHLDPCSNASSLVQASVEVHFGGKLGVVPVLRSRVQDEHTSIATFVGDGLALDWTVYRDAFFNPPWESLGAWLQKAACSVASVRTAKPQPLCACGWDPVAPALQHVFGLVPLRTHRRYWLWAWTASAIAFLPPVAYGGYGGDTLPTSCVMLYWGPDSKRFKAVFEGIESTVLTRLPGKASLTRMAQKKTKPKQRTRSRAAKREPAFTPVATEWRRADGSWTEDGEQRFLAELAIHLATALPIEVVANVLLAVSRCEDWKQKQALERKLNDRRKWNERIPIPTQRMATLANLNDLVGRNYGNLRGSMIAKAAELILTQSAMPSSIKVETPKADEASPAKKAAATRRRSGAAKKANATRGAAGRKKAAKKAAKKARSGKPKGLGNAARAAKKKPARSQTGALRDHMQHMTKVIEKSKEGAVSLAKKKRPVQETRDKRRGTPEKQPPPHVPDSRQPALPGVVETAGSPAPSKNGKVGKRDRSALVAAVTNTILKGRGDTPVKVGEIAEKMGVSKPTALRVMRDCIAAKLVKKTGAGRSAGYVSQVAG